MSQRGEEIGVMIGMTYNSVIWLAEAIEQLATNPSEEEREKISRSMHELQIRLKANLPAPEVPNASRQSSDRST